MYMSGKSCNDKKSFGSENKRGFPFYDRLNYDIILCTASS